MVVTSNSMLCRQNVVVGLVLLLLGVSVLFGARKIQEINVRWHERHPRLAALNPFSAWMRTPDATLVVRVGGLVLIGFSLVVLYFAWRACSG